MLSVLMSLPNNFSNQELILTNSNGRQSTPQYRIPTVLGKHVARGKREREQASVSAPVEIKAAA